jgi:TRAP-type C4-dicarboxylate transport system substrate-binding protein
MKRISRAVAFACISLGCAVSAAPMAPITIKLGSLAPTGSPWDKGLRSIAAEWSRISGGAVTLKIYAGGIVGDEMDMIRKMRIEQLNAAGLTGVGLCRIHQDILTIMSPLLIGNDAQLTTILDTLKPTFEKGLEEKGFKVIAWNKVGWVHFFSKQPIVKPDDLRKMKLFIWAGDPDAVQTWKDMGFHPVPLNVTDLMTALQSGMVEAFSATALSAATNQWFGLAQHMSAMNWAPLLGGIVVTKKTWDRIPAELRPQLMSAAQKIGASMEAEVADADRQAIDIMKQNGLVVDPVPDAAVAEWKAIVTRVAPSLFGKSLNKSLYERINSIVGKSK